MTAPMSKARRREVLKHWRAECMAWDRYREAVTTGLGLEPEGMLFEHLCRMQDQYTRAIAELVGDQDGWLNWYAQENDYGRKGYEARARASDKLRPIRSVAQLARLIEVSL